MLTTVYEFPPIPVRSFDWKAFDADTYDGAPGAGTQIVGRGATEAEAIADYVFQKSEQEADRG